MRIRKVLSFCLALCLMLTMLPVFTQKADAASAKVYYNIDFSAAVAKSTILQHNTSDCSIVSMATIEAYLYGATSAADRKTVYDAVCKANKDNGNDYAYWANVGYSSSTNINWETVYKQLETGFPCIIYRNSGHWAVVAGYKGSTSKLEPDNFIVVNVYRNGTSYYPSSNKDVKTVKQWRGDASVTKMVYRKNGIAITGLANGIHAAINVPRYIHPTGEGQGVYGHITSNSNLDTVQVRIINAKTGDMPFNKTVNPNAKSYKIFNLDSEIKFAELPAGDYYYTVYAKDTAGNTKIVKRYFQVGNSWPATLPAEPVYTIKFDGNGGTGSAAGVTLKFLEGSFTLPQNPYSRPGYEFLGWSVQRTPDNKWYVQEVQTWQTEMQMALLDYDARIYEAGYSTNIGWPWIKNCGYLSPTFTFYAQWKQLCPSGHSWDSGVVTKQPTETATGTKTFTCSVCGTQKTETLPATGHTHSYSSSVTNPTCKDKGYTTYTCACGHTYKDNYVNAKGHTYSNGLDGTCNVCGIHRETTENRTVMHMFRMYDPNSGEHFYTGSVEERENLVAAGWNYEGVGFTFSRTTGLPVYRLYDPITGEHLYTMDEEEKAMLMAQGWNFEGIAFNSAYDTEVPQYRLHNPNASRGAYHFTASLEERDFLISIGWEDQGIGFYSSWK